MTGQDNGRYFYVGVDLGQKQDYTIVVLVEKVKGIIKLRKVKRFPLGTEYQTILDYLKKLEKKFSIRGLYIDQTGVGEVFVENAKKQGLLNVNGMILSQPTKQNLMTNLKQGFQQKQVGIPFDRDLINELNAETAELTETGKTKFGHRSGTHDDRLWALALAVYAARNQAPKIDFTVYTSRRPGEGPVRIVDWNKKDALPPGNYATCMFCGGRRKPGTDCPCGHTKADGTQIPPEGGSPEASWRGSPNMIGFFCHR
jgi:phage FluMu gp28-like protein